MSCDRTTIRQHLLAKVRQRGLEKTICPSEVARDLGGDDWRLLMETVRQVGAELVTEGAIAALQKGRVVDPLTAKGPIRFRVTEQGMAEKDVQRFKDDHTTS
ncbi:DUF3253 domain-containing protein [Oscillatoria sp. FACHB-1407]|uniref:DUF3253 domain-containing protein n=1 Tax=Oscillatoria sp. FACHB-1407 TaxID=2692847 RepID=UPI001684FBBD|nr:DUF3253 domain-containing protein [Oscillatoria sp. FACHB-1407]MBD2462755.1 DUF3253 domain-containing protein [Oscillatoria sp. FACHB-1407]